jgi:hypothetical protein
VQNQFNCNIYIKGKKLTHLQFLTSQFNHKDFNSNQNVIRTNSLPVNMLPKNKLTKTRSLLKNNIDTPNTPVTKKRLSKIILLPNNSFQEESENSEVDIPYSLKQSFKNKKTLIEIEQNEKNRKFEKQNNEIDNIISIKNSENLIKESIISNKKNTLDIIKSNIEKNSLNLNNPKYFYSKYFSSVIHENNPKKEFRKRLKN